MTRTFIESQQLAQKKAEHENNLFRKRLEDQFAKQIERIEKDHAKKEQTKAASEAITSPKSDKSATRGRKNSARVEPSHQKDSFLPPVTDKRQQENIASN